MVFTVIGVRKEGQDKNAHINTINQKVLVDGNKKLGTLIPLKGVRETQFKCGSLDNLMEQLDFFQKNEVQLENSCKRIESLYFDLCNELEPDKKDPQLVVMKGNQQKPVMDYLNQFEWEVSLYPYEKTLRDNGHKCIEKQLQADKEIKKYLESIQEIKSKLTALHKKSSANYANTDLAELIYDDSSNVKGDRFVSTTMFTNILVVVHQKKEALFQENYYKFLMDLNMAELKNWRAKKTDDEKAKICRRLLQEEKKRQAEAGLEEEG